jgi:hypothetical protein
MRFFCATGLILCASLGSAVNLAQAQSGPDGPFLVPLPSVAPVESTSIAASYNTRSAPTPTYGSAFLTKQEPATDSAASPTPAPTPFEESMQESCWGDGGECCERSCCGAWFGCLGGLVMTRNRGPSDVMTYQATTNIPVMTMQDANAGWAPGGDVTFGYAFGGPATVGPWGASGAPALAFTWWGTGEMNGFAQADDPTGVQATALNASFSLLGVTIDGNPSSFYFDGASSQAIFRTDIANNFEANLLSGTLLTTTKIQVIGLVGFRYFRFYESLSFGSVTFGETWGSNGGANEAYMTFRSINNLYGAQLGSIFNYQFAPRWAWFFTPKAGVYGNQMSLRTQLYSGNGVSSFDFSNHKADVAFLGQIDTGLTFKFRDNWSAYLGYRTVGASNLALGEHQFAPSFGDIKQSGSLILHGGMFGLVWTY